MAETRYRRAFRAGDLLAAQIMRAQGMTIINVARKLGFHKNTVQAYLREASITPCAAEAVTDAQQPHPGRGLVSPSAAPARPNMASLSATTAKEEVLVAAQIHRFGGCRIRTLANVRAHLRGGALGSHGSELGA